MEKMMLPDLRYRSVITLRYDTVAYTAWGAAQYLAQGTEIIYEDTGHSSDDGWPQFAFTGKGREMWGLLKLASTSADDAYETMVALLREVELCG